MLESAVRKFWLEVAIKKESNWIFIEKMWIYIDTKTSLPVLRRSPKLIPRNSITDEVAYNMASDQPNFGVQDKACYIYFLPTADRVVGLQIRPNFSIRLSE